MKKAIKDRWVQALLSGKYKQTQKVLYNKNQNAYCCLGVLCRIENLKTAEKLEDEHLIFFEYGGEQKWSTLPDKFKLFLNLTSNQLLKLMEMNDDEHCSFKQIAEYIQTKIPEEE